MKRTMMVAALAAVLGMACMNERPRLGFGVKTQALDGGCECVEVPEMPAIGGRLNFDEYNWDIPLYKVGRVQSAFTIVMAHPASASKFLAYGWDPKGRANVFAGEGTIATSYARLTERINNDQLTTIGEGLITVSWGGSGEIGPGPGGPGPGGPVTDGAAYLAAYKMWLAHEELKDVPLP